MVNDIFWILFNRYRRPKTQDISCPCPCVFSACVLINYCVLLLLHDINTYKYRRIGLYNRTATYIVNFSQLINQTFCATMMNLAIISSWKPLTKWYKINVVRFLVIRSNSGAEMSWVRSVLSPEVSVHRPVTLCRWAVDHVTT